MKNNVYAYILGVVMMTATLMGTSCTDDKLVEAGTVGDEQVAVTLNFTAQSNDRISVTTRTTLDEVPESRVQNFFLFFFVNGTRIYSHYFDNTNKLDTQAEVINSDDNNWYVDNKSDNDDESDITVGTVRAHVPQSTNATIYMVTNIDADMVNISPEKLNTIRTEQELKDLTATLNQEITSRNGYFPMSGKLENVTVDPNTGSGITVTGENATATANVVLHRLDAKVEVFVRTATDYEVKETTKVDGSDVTTTQTLKGFVPESWRVVNLPKSCYVAGRATDEANYDCTTTYFNTEAVSFETSEEEEFTYGEEKYTTTTHGFSFYMMENRPTYTTSVNKNFHLRDLRQKGADGQYTTNPADMWVYAPENGTYLEIKGEVEMDVDVSNQAKTQTLKAAVTYYIHLGDIATSMDDYSINRNTHYKYTITIKGVDKISLEVETSLDGPENVKEENAGATGNVYVAKESMYTFDAHYGQRVFCFDAAYIEPENMTWFVQTPFGKTGTPPSLNGVDIPAGFDYKWVEFLVNDMESVTDKLDTNTTLEVYSQKNQPYPGYKGNPNNTKSNDLMDVIAFTKYMKEERIKLSRYLNGETTTNTSDFRKEFDQAWYDKFGAEHAYRWRIYVTAFVNEFYYEEHPITGDKSADLWKQFVNQPNRIMHILCDSQESLDGESSSTGSVITIRQRSIQTPYNMNNASLMTAWGCETVDETADSYLWFYSEDETQEHITANEANTLAPSSAGNESSSNGLFNTAKLWGYSGENSLSWADYVDYNRLNDYQEDGESFPRYWMKDGKAVLRYTPLMRNRDNDGDGYIDADEMRWYIASLEQIFGLYIGDQGLSSDAQLYDHVRKGYTANDLYETGHPLAGRYKHLLHIVSSTKSGNSNTPVVVWAEEGVSTSYYRQEFTWVYPETSKMDRGAQSIRCVRNLGMELPTASNVLTESANTPEDLIKVEYPTGTITQSSVFVFDLTNVAPKSLRSFYSTHELEPTDEFDEMARPYKKFQTGGLFSTGNYANLYNTIVSGNSPITDEGYRVPNVREAALMMLYCDTYSAWWSGYIQPITYYSRGSMADDATYRLKPNPTWGFDVNRFSSVGVEANYTRAVQDIPVN